MLNGKLLPAIAANGKAQGMSIAFDVVEESIDGLVGVLRRVLLLAEHDIKHKETVVWAR